VALREEREQLMKQAS
jgi:chromosome segregation ATPase